MKLVALSIIFQIGFSSRGFANANGAMLSILQMSGYFGYAQYKSANAQMGGGSPMQMQPSASDRSFRQIEQPLPVKVGVILGGLTLIGAELWWFLGRKQQKQQAIQSNQGERIKIGFLLRDRTKISDRIIFTA